MDVPLLGCCPTLAVAKVSKQRRQGECRSDQILAAGNPGDRLHVCRMNHEQCAGGDGHRLAAGKSKCDQEDEACYQARPDVTR